MSHRDDLETEYKAASNEQPSTQTDAFILKAAAEALQENADNSDKESQKSPVIRGQFSLRRWQMPVSLAAAAVLTVSVVTSLKPWRVSVPVSTLPQVAESELDTPRTPELQSIPAEATAAISSEKELSLVTDEESTELKTGVLAEKTPQSREKSALLRSRSYAKTRKVLPQTQLQVTTLYPRAKSLPAFELLDHRGRIFSNEQLKNKWSVVFFGYTYCPDICPTTMNALSAVSRKLAPEINNQTQFIFISIDPERDSASKLAEYMDFFNPDFIGLTGTAGQLQKLSQALGAMYMKVPAQQDYLMSHSNSLFVINPQSQRHGIINQHSGSLDISALASDLQLIIGKK